MATDALVVPVVVAGTVAGAATNVVAPPPPKPLVITGLGPELIDALTVTSGFAYCDGGIT